jgi:YggT family protein
MPGLLVPLFEVLLYVIRLYTWCLFGAILLTNLVQFGVVNQRNRLVYIIWDVLTRLTEPALRPLRRIIPSVGAVDLSPIALFILLYLLQRYLEMFMLGALY